MLHGHQYRMEIAHAGSAMTPTWHQTDIDSYPLPCYDSCSDGARCELQGSDQMKNWRIRESTVACKMSIFQNAISSIEVALEDFSSGEKGRLLAAVRGLHSGILLLFKEKLHRLSPQGSNEVLIKQHILPRLGANGEVIFVGEGRKTVDVMQIKERFDSLGIQADWKRFEKMSRLRNDIEHYFTVSGRDTIRGLISDAFIIIRDFLANELKMDPKSAMRDAAWRTLLSVSEVFEREAADCRKRIESIDWESAELSDAILDVNCNSCGSKLVVPAGATKDDGLECRSCDEFELFEDCAERVLCSHLDWKNHVSLKDGAGEVLIRCPFCHRDGYVVEEEQCAICGESCRHTCDMCAGTVPSSELSDGNLCGYCDHMMSKDD